MIKHLRLYYLIYTLIFGLTGCNLSSKIIEQTKIARLESPTVINIISTPTSTSFQTLTPTITLISPTPAINPNSPSTITPTPLDTLEPAKADAIILAMLQNPGNCVAPCFWSIVPGETSSSDVNQFFYHLGISPYNSKINGKNYTSYDYQLNKDLRIAITLGLVNNIVENMKIGIVTEAINGKAVADWMTYSPNKVIKQYGNPSSVDFSWNLEYGNTSFDTAMYFDKYNLIVEYHSPDGPTPSSPIECPLEVNYDSIRIWIGKNPQNPPIRGVSLDEATTLTMDAFVSLMTGNPEDSCFILDIEAFLPDP